MLKCLVVRGRDAGAGDMARPTERGQRDEGGNAKPRISGHITARTGDSCSSGYYLRLAQHFTETRQIRLKNCEVNTMKSAQSEEDFCWQWD